MLFQRFKVDLTKEISFKLCLKDCVGIGWSEKQRDLRQKMLFSNAQKRGKMACLASEK